MEGRPPDGPPPEVHGQLGPPPDGQPGEQGRRDAVAGRSPTGQIVPNPPAVAATPTAGGLDRPISGPGRTSRGRLLAYLAVYSVLRLALVAALTAGLMIFMPLIVALLFAIIVQLPLSWLLFTGPRRRVNDAMAEVSQRRRAERARLQSALSGGEPDR
jgi:hypothetical protein